VSTELQERIYEHDCLHALSFVCEVAVAFNVNNQYSRTNKMHILYSVYYELTASTCFKHYLLIFRRCYTNDTWYIACVLCLLAATARSIPIVFAVPPEDEQVVLETRRGC
jgi:hypothetical protein